MYGHVDVVGNCDGDVFFFVLVVIFIFSIFKGETDACARFSFSFRIDIGESARASRWETYIANVHLKCIHADI
jgi:hypothetical protein